MDFHSADCRGVYQLCMPVESVGGLPDKIPVVIEKMKIELLENFTRPSLICVGKVCTSYVRIDTRVVQIILACQCVFD